MLLSKPCDVQRVKFVFLAKFNYYCVCTGKNQKIFVNSLFIKLTERGSISNISNASPPVLMDTKHRLNVHKLFAGTVPAIKNRS